MKNLIFALMISALPALGAPRVVGLPSKSPLVSFRFVFTTGAASDPANQAGVAALTSELLGGGGSKELTYKQMMDALYPMASSVSVYSDKEMTTFLGGTHVDNLEAYYALLRDAILHPGWRADDFKRVKDDTLNSLRVSLRGNNDEELAKEQMYIDIYRGRPYGHENRGTGGSIEKLTVVDLQAFYKKHYTQANLIIGVAGGYTPEFLERVKRDFAALPEGPADKPDLKQPEAVSRSRMTIIEKDTRSVAWSFGYSIPVRRGDADFPALLVAQSYLGQHRESAGQLFVRLREARGLNYGDYAYIEYFPQGMFRMEPQPNLGRHQQIFQMWIRPVEPANAGFALRAGLFELDKLVKNGIPESEFERARGFLAKFVNVLTKSKSAELGYAIDSVYYGIPNYNEYLKAGLGKLTLAEVNRVIRKYLRTDNLVITAVAKDAVGLKAKLLSGDTTGIQYNSEKPRDILDEDKVMERWPLGLKADDVKIVPVDSVFEN